MSQSRTDCLRDGDVLIHDYFGVDLEVLWKTLHENLPPVEPQLLGLLSEIQT